MALHALDDELAGKRATTAIFDHVPELMHSGRLTDDAVVEHFMAGFERRHHFGSAVDGRAFFIRRDEKANRALMIRVRRNELFGSDHHRCERSFHVGRATPIQLAVLDGGNKRVGVPLIKRAGRYHVGMPGKHKDGRRRAAPRINIFHAVAAVTKHHWLDREADFL